MYEKNLEEFKNMTIGWKINDLLLHYKAGHDALYVQKATIFKTEMDDIESRLERYETALKTLAQTEPVAREALKETK
jgi:hypothetical protein